MEKFHVYKGSSQVLTKVPSLKLDLLHINTSSIIN